MFDQVETRYKIPTKCAYEILYRKISLKYRNVGLDTKSLQNLKDIIMVPVI